MGRNIISPDTASGLLASSGLGTTTAPEGTVLVETANPHDAPAGVASSALRRALPGHVPGGASGMPVAVDERARINGAETTIVGARGNVIGSAVRPDQLPVPVKRYRIVNGGFAMMDGSRTTIRAGKEVDERQYDLRLLKRQGFKLEEITDDTEPLAYEETVDPLTPPLV